MVPWGGSEEPETVGSHKMLETEEGKGIGKEKE